MPDLPECTFNLNNQPFSALICGSQKYQAFSGDMDGRNNPGKAAVANVGPIPPGMYYIVDRPVGGRFPWLEAEIHDLISGSEREHWFALYAKGTLSDFTFVQGIRRGNFRLHPVGRLRLSEGCITLTSTMDFDALSKYLLGQPVTYIPGTKIRYYGTVTVTGK
ncbi:MAG TPA: DUF2778 domain-containing protein [Acetobacteraceae bacterium]|nr:DUF2778 domain-containing protein [Acetobacteraceae bacterium]